MISLIFEIFNLINQYKCDVCFDTEADRVSYCVGWNNGNITVNEYDEYIVNTDDIHGYEYSGFISDTVGIFKDCNINEYYNTVIDYIRYRPELELRFGESFYNSIKFQKLTIGDIE